ncbi:flavodoxin domain-containing protein [Puniceicoccaceae bacterium K14]|nr:flavodoxin domain-containing protein [Puniceicoccaceae bacterium K14]
MSEKIIHIYYATMTGNAEDLAKNAEKRVQAAGYAPKLLDLSDVSPSCIKENATALFIVSTWGDGEPPEDAEDFYAKLENCSDNMESLNYSILGLGDSSYPDFNEFARCLDKELLRCHAQPFLERVEADFDFEDTYDEWIDKVLESLPTVVKQTSPV